VNDFNGSDEGINSLIATDGGAESIGGRSDDMSQNMTDPSSVRCLSPHSASTSVTSNLNTGREESNTLPTEEHRNYSRSSPASSVNAFVDESSQHNGSGFDDGNSSEMMVSLLRRMEALQTQRDEQMRDHIRLMMGGLSNHLTNQMNVQIEKSIRKQMQSVLVPAMGRIVLHTMENNFMKPVQSGFEHMLSHNVLPSIENKLNEAMTNILPNQLESGVRETLDKMVEDVKQPVRESFRECFQTVIIPSFQAATQKMFEQINDTFVKGTQHTIADNNGKIGTLQAQLDHLIQSVDNLSEKMDSFASIPIPTVEVSPLVDAKTLKFETQCTEIKQYLKANDFESAFQTVCRYQYIVLCILSLNNVNLVLGFRRRKCVISILRL